MPKQKLLFTSRSGLTRQTIGLFYLPLVLTVLFIVVSHWSAVGLVASVLLSIYISSSIPDKVEVFSERINVHYMFSKKSYSAEQIQAVYISKTKKRDPIVSLASTHRKSVKVIPVNPKEGELEPLLQHFANLDIKIVRD